MAALLEGSFMVNELPTSLMCVCMYVNTDTQTHRHAWGHWTSRAVSTHAVAIFSSWRDRHPLMSVIREEGLLGTISVDVNNNNNNNNNSLIIIIIIIITPAKKNGLIQNIQYKMANGYSWPNWKYAKTKIEGQDQNKQFYFLRKRKKRHYMQYYKTVIHGTQRTQHREWGKKRLKTISRIPQQSSVKATKLTHKNIKTIPTDYQ